MTSRITGLDPSPCHKLSHVSDPPECGILYGQPLLDLQLQTFLMVIPRTPCSQVKAVRGRWEVGVGIGPHNGIIIIGIA